MDHLYKDCVIIDVRDPRQYNQGHVLNAINIPYDQLDHASRLNPFIRLAVYSSSGYESKLARKRLQIQGFEVDDLGDYDSIHLPKEEFNRTQPDWFKAHHH